MVPNGWEVKKFGDLFNVKSGFGFKHSEYADSGTPLIKIDNVSHGYVKWNNVSYLPDSYREEYSDILLKEGDLLLALNRPITQGKLKLVKLTKNDVPSILYQRVGRIDFKTNDLEKDFYLYLLDTAIYRFVSHKAIGSDQPFISTTELKKLNIVKPPLPEQRKIAKILSTWDKAISTTERLIDNSKQQKKALMQQLLTGKKRLLDENGVRFEGEWRKVHIKDCAYCLDNKREPLNSVQRSKMQGTVPYWGANGVVDYISDYIFDETIVLLAEDGGYFDEYQTRRIANISYGQCWVNNHAHILKAKSNCINEWIYYCLVHKNILAFVNGGTRAKLNKSDMLMIPINLPSIVEQQKIAKVLSTADQEIEALQRKLDGLQQEKKALMQQLLTGKRRVNLS